MCIYLKSTKYSLKCYIQKQVYKSFPIPTYFVSLFNYCLNNKFTV